MIPDPLGVLTDTVAGWSWDQVANGIAGWILGAIAELLDGILNFLKTTVRPDVTDAWFSGPGSPYSAVRNVSAVLLLAFLLAGIIQGLIAGDIGGMFRRVAADAPLAVIGMVGTTVVVDLLLDLTDSLSTAVLGDVNGGTLGFLESFGVTAHLATAGFSTVIIGLVAVAAAVLLWIELMVRSSLMYLLVAMSPLAFAASVWPTAKGVLRRLIELMLGVILSKLVISIALSIGVAALGGAGGSAGDAPGTGEWAAQGLGTLVTGTSILCLAAFSPFMVLKLIPVAESAIAAQGVSRGPLNSARSGMNAAYSAQSMGRLAGGGGGGGPAAGGPPADASSPSFGIPADGAAGAVGEAGATGAVGSGGAAGGATAGGSAAAGVSAAGAAGGAAAAGAAAGPAAVGVLAIEGAKKAKSTAEGTFDQAGSTTASSSGGESGDAGWQRVANSPTPPDPSEPMPEERR